MYLCLLPTKTTRFPVAMKKTGPPAFTGLNALRPSRWVRLLCLLMLIPTVSYSQNLTKIMGTVIDRKSKQPIPFVNIFFKGSGIATTTDFEGRYSLETKTPTDTLQAQYMGYENATSGVVKNRFQFIDFELKPVSYELAEVVILPGLNPAEVLLKKVIDHKAFNNPDDFDAYEFEAYTKIQIDANNFTERLKDRGIMKPFRFVFENVDTSIINGKAYLPVFFTETLSEVYYRKNPQTLREIIKATRISGMKNASISSMLGNSYVNANLYKNYIDMFEKNFVSPLANFGLAYYRYYLTDSSFIDHDWCYKLSFKPRRSQELTFTGTLWITDSTYALKKADIRLVGDANVNLINEIVINQDFQRVDSTHFLLASEELVADLNITENSKWTIGFYVHRNSSFRNLRVNERRPDADYNIPNDVVVLDSATQKDDLFWARARHDSLTAEQLSIYHMTDTIQTVPAFKIYKELFTILTTGYKVWGQVEIGPWSSIYSFNEIEGDRIRLGGRTSNKFSTMSMIEAHLAYGTRDRKFKGGADFWYRFKKNPNSGFGMAYRYDIEQLGESQNALRTDYIVGSLIRRNPQNKLSMVEEIKGFYEHEWFFGFSNKLMITRREIFPMGSTLFTYNDNGRVFTRPSITTSEISFSLHFAFHEKIIMGEFERMSLGTHYPVLDVGYAYGAKDLWGGDYDYHRLQLSLKQRYKVGALGWSRYYIEAGKIWGTLPYSLLKLHEANETLSFDEYAINTMNYYEFVSDEYLHLYFTHHFDGLLFNKIPLLKKLRWREVIHGRCVMGHMNDANRAYNNLPANTYTLGQPYYEAGVGIENIFTFLRLDGIWRFSYLDHKDVSQFTFMFSFWFSF